MFKRKIPVFVLGFILIMISLAPASSSGRSSDIGLTVDSEQVSLSTANLELLIDMTNGTAYVRNFAHEPVMELEFSSVMTFGGDIIDEIPIDEPQYMSDLADHQWEVIASNSGTNPAYGKFAEVTVGTQIDLDMPDIPDIPGGNPNVPIGLPETIMHWADIEIRYMVTERNATVQSPGGNTYAITGQSQVKIDLKIIINDQYSPGSVCVMQNLVLNNQSLGLSVQTPSGDAPIPGQYGDINPVDEPAEGSDAAFVFGASGENETGRYSWAGFSEIDGAEADVEDFYAPTPQGLSIYFCYNVPDGVTEIYHDPSITLNPEAANMVLPVPEIMSRYSVILLTVGIIAGIVMAVAVTAKRHSSEDPIDLENNYYYKK